MSASGTIRWAVAVTTAPRREPTVHKTIESLRIAGWDDPIVFAEPDSEEVDAKAVINAEKLGVWHNWLQAVDACLAQDVDAIMTVQDDTEFHPEARVFAEAALWPHPRCGFLSLYTPKHYSYDRRRLRARGIITLVPKSLWGAMAMIFHPGVLREMRSTPLATSWVGLRSTMSPSKIEAKQADPSTIRNSDTAIGLLCRKLDRKMCYVNPSIVQHVSIHSSIGNRPAEGKRAAAFLADNEKSLFDQIPIHEKHEIQA